VAADPFRIPAALLERIAESRNTVVDARGDLEQLVSQLEDVTSGARAVWEERTEKWQDGDRGQAASTWLENLEELVDNLNELRSAMETAEESLLDPAASPDY